MRIIIAGSRSVIFPLHVEMAMKACPFLPPDGPIEVVSGLAPGADRLGIEWARKRNVPIVRFPADWNTHGKSAGFIRNEQMADYADALVAVWDGKSRGTKHMIKAMERREKPYFVWTVGPCQ